MRHEKLINYLHSNFGPGWDINVDVHGVIEVNAPLFNEIGDRYQFFITQTGTDKYEIDDDVNSLGEFGMYGLPTDHAYEYLKLNHITVNNEAIIMISNQADLLDTIYKLMRIMIGLTAIQQLESKKLQHK